MKTLLPVLFLVVALVSAENVKWNGFVDGIARVKKQSKPAVIDFYTEWCGWCKKMDATTYSDTKVAGLLAKKFVCIKLNPETSKETISYDGKTFTPMEFSQAVGVQGFPATAFMDKKGKLITLLPGFVPAETFYQILTYINDECYTRGVSFDDYQKQADGCVKK
ncbi:MAG: thioredoxin fold domain-containing protein [Fibrobacterota bacterium]